MSYTYKYPRPAVTADCVIITREAGSRALLIKVVANHSKTAGQFLKVS